MGGRSDDSSEIDDVAVVGHRFLAGDLWGNRIFFQRSLLETINDSTNNFPDFNHGSGLLAGAIQREICFCRGGDVKKTLVIAFGLIGLSLSVIGLYQIATANSGWWNVIVGLIVVALATDNDVWKEKKQ